MATLANSISDILKRQYEGPIREQLNLEALIYNLFSEGPHQWAGSNVIIPLHTRGVVAGSIVYGGEGQVVPAASNQDYLTLTVGYSSLYASFSVTGQADASAPGNGGSEAAFVGAMFSEMRGLEQDIRHSLDRDMFCGQGCWGWLIDNDAGLPLAGPARPNDARMVSGANNIAARLAEHVAAGTVFYVKVANVPRDATLNWNHLEDNTGGAPTLAGEVFTIDAVNVTDGVVTFNSLANPNDGPHAGVTGALVDTNGLMIVETDIAGNRILAEQCHGLNSLGWDAGYFGNVRLLLANTVLRGFAYSMPRSAAAVAAGGRSSGTDIDLSTMQRLVDAIEDNCGENVDCLIMNRFTRSEYRDIFQDTIIGGGGQGPQYLPGETNAKGGFTTSELMFDQRVPIKVSNQAPLGVVYFIVRDTINTYTLRPGGFQEFNDAGDIVTQARDGASGRMTDIREGFWKQYFDLVSEKPRALAILAGIQYTRV